MNAVAKLNTYELQPKAEISDLKQHMLRSVASGDLIRVDPPVENYHTPELYARRIHSIPAGTTIVTKVHKSEHISVALQGHCTVVDQDGNKTEVIAPAVFVTKPGTYRAIYAHDEVSWLTVHACKAQDMQTIEDELVCDSSEEYDRLDYCKVLAEHGLIEKQARDLSKMPESQMPMPLGEERVLIKKSLIQGYGVFADEDILGGERIAPAVIGVLRTPAGRYTNHSAHPNAEFRMVDGGIDLFALKPLIKGREITVCYRKARQTALDVIQRMELQK